MAAPRARVHRDAFAHLGPDAVRLARECLFELDCQSCGKALAGCRPSLVFDTTPWGVEASLHHPGCRRPEYRDHFVSVFVTNVVTYHYYMDCLFTSSTPGVPSTLPFVIVNPGMESVPLQQVDGAWQVKPPMADRGFTPLSKSSITALARGVRIHLGGLAPSSLSKPGFTEAVITVDDEPRWTVTLLPKVVEAIRRDHAAFLVLTYDLDPWAFNVPGMTQGKAKDLLSRGNATGCARIPLAERPL